MKDIKKQLVFDLLKSAETKDHSALKVIHPDLFIQHSQHVENGKAGMIKQLQELPYGIKVDIRRIFRDEDYVFAHVEYHLETPIVSFNIFRFDNEQIVEHWNNIQEKQPLNLSGRSMIDGDTTLKDLHKTDQNKAIANSLISDIFFEGEVEKLTSYFDGDAYIQHNPWLSDEISSIKKVINDWVKTEKIMKYETVHQLLGEGNFVLLLSEGYFHGVPTSFCDLFRIEKGKIAEHWDNFESILPADQRKNTQGKF